MKKFTIISLLLIVYQNAIPIEHVYTNSLYCTSILTLYDNGRADWHDCEIDETFDGYYWQHEDTLFVETFCSSIIHEDHRCFSPRLDISIIKSDTLLNIGYKEKADNDSTYPDSIHYFLSPHAYVLKKQ